MAQYSTLVSPSDTTNSPIRQSPLRPVYGFDTNDGIITFMQDHANARWDGNDGDIVSHEVTWPSPVDGAYLRNYDGNNGLVVGIEEWWEEFYLTSLTPSASNHA